MVSMIRGVPIGVFLVIVAIFLAMTGIAVFVGLRARKRASLIKSMPTSRIGTAEDGYREFEGRIDAIDGQMLAAPLTGWPCAWWHARVEQWVRRSTGTDKTYHWAPLRESTSSAPFFIRDASGQCAVYPWRAEVTPTDKSVWYGASPVPADPNPPRLKPTESSTGTIEVAGGDNRRFRYSEERMYAGDPLLVLGEFSRAGLDPEPDDDEGDDADGEDDAADLANRGVGSAGADVADADEVDRIWAKNDRYEELAARAGRKTRSAISRGSGAQPFILSTTPQAEHVAMSELGGKTALGVALLPLAIAALLFWVRFG